jgi:hypothetical protein
MCVTYKPQQRRDVIMTGGCCERKRKKKEIKEKQKLLNELGHKFKCVFRRTVFLFHIPTTENISQLEYSNIKRVRSNLEQSAVQALESNWAVRVRYLLCFPSLNSFVLADTVSLLRALILRADYLDM